MNPEAVTISQIDRVSAVFEELPNDLRTMHKAENRSSMSVWRMYLPYIVDKLQAGASVLLVNPSPPLI